jgi:CHASE2 domain-containing sensor protein
MTEKVTKWSILLGLLFYLVWDIHAATNLVEGDTISEVLLSITWEWPTVPFAWGVITGHLFWPVERIHNKWFLLAILWAICILVLIFDILWLRDVSPIASAAVGIFLGHWLWPQRRK